MTFLQSDINNNNKNENKKKRQYNSKVRFNEFKNHFIYVCV